MPLDYQQNINGSCIVGVWQIEEPESFFIDAGITAPRINHPHKRLQHLAGRYLLKQLRPDFPLAEIEIHQAGKPFLASNHCWFSVSHCGKSAAAIVDENLHVGVDIEAIAARLQKVMHKFISKDEHVVLGSAKLRPPNEALFTAELLLLTITWSVKEAVYKWYGKGGVDFRKHMQLTSLEQTGYRFSGACRFLLNTSIELQFVGVILHNNVVAWVRS